jgi:hypothetical protein
MTDVEAYTQGTSYEIFIRRAHKLYERKSSVGAEAAYMKNLINTENGADLKRLVGTYEKQFAKVSGYMSKALDKYLKLKLNSEERNAVISSKEELEGAESSVDLMKIVEDVLDATRRHKEY